jgi:hypothetical protein
LIVGKLAQQKKVSAILITIAASGVVDECEICTPIAPKGGNARQILVQQHKNSHLKTATQNSIWHLVLNLDVLL